MAVLTDEGAPGADGVSRRDIIEGPGASASRAERHEAWRTERARPQPVPPVALAEPDGRLRPRGIPPVKGRVVQTAARPVLEPIFAADVLDSSFGPRPGKDAHPALDAIRRPRTAGFVGGDDADLRSSSDAIPHDPLIECLGRRSADGAVLTRIRIGPAAPVTAPDDRGRTTVSRTTRGTPQGGVLSPSLATSSRPWFEEAFVRKDGPGTWAHAERVRSADDLVVPARYRARRLTDRIATTREGRFRLTIDREEARLVKGHQPGAGPSFLGFRPRYDRSRFGRARRDRNVFPAAQAPARAREKRRERTDHPRCSVPIPEVIPEVNRRRRGRGNYFRPGSPGKAFAAPHCVVQDRMRRHSRRGSRRPLRPPAGGTSSADRQRLGLQRLRASRGRLPVHAFRATESG